MEPSLRRSSRPVKKKKFFIDEIENIYSTSKRVSGEYLLKSQEDKIVLTHTNLLSRSNIASNHKKRVVSKYARLGGHQYKHLHANSSASLQRKITSLKQQNTTPILSDMPDSSQFIEPQAASQPALENSTENDKIDTMLLSQLGKWKPIDDLKLIVNTVQCNDLRRVHQCIKFTCNFSLPEIEERWYRLLYDPVISALSIKGMNQHLDCPEILAKCYEEALFSDDEERVLLTILSNQNAKLEHFQHLLTQYPSVFLPSRTAKHLQEHWAYMKYHTLLPDQIVGQANNPKWGSLLTFANAHIDPSLAPELSFDDMEKLVLVSSEINENLLLTNTKPYFGSGSATNNSNTIPPKSLINPDAHGSRIEEDKIGNGNSRCDINNSSAIKETQPHNQLESSAPFSVLKKYMDVLGSGGGVRSLNNTFGSKNNLSWVYDREYQLALMHRLQRIDQLEASIPLWQTIVDKEMGIAPEFDDSTFAALQGKSVRFLIKTRDVSFGRYANNYIASLTGEPPLDIDLSLEGPCRKVSRLQGHIKLKSSLAPGNNANTNNQLSNTTIAYDFYMANEGRRPFFVEGKPVLTGQASKLRDGAVVEISYLQFTFHINNRLINQLKENSN